MKGLIIKDIMCLKKQLITFIYVLIAVCVISVMYVLSAKYGNLALAGRQMAETNQASDLDIKNLASLSLVLFMLLPIAVIGDMVNVFQEDGKAGFNRIVGAFPLSIKKRLLSKYISIYALFLIGVVVDLFLALLLSAITDLMTFGELLGVIISSASIMSIYSALVIFFCLILGYGKEPYAQFFSLFLMATVTVLANFNTVKKITAYIMTEDTNMLSGVSRWGALELVKNKAWLLLLIAVIVSISSYAASLIVAERKRGVV